MKALLLLLCLLVLAKARAQEEMTGKVVAVIDGNTIEISDKNNTSLKVMFYGIDCPEPGQEFSDKATKLTEKMLLKKDVTVSIKGKDRWGIYIGIVMKGGTDPRIELLEEGLAWTVEKNPLPELEEIRIKAKEKAKGLWKEENPVPPWTYRRQQTMLQAKSN